MFNKVLILPDKRFRPLLNDFVDNEVFFESCILDFEINKTSFIRKLSFVDIFYNFGPKLRWQTPKMHESHHEI